MAILGQLPTTPNATQFPEMTRLLGVGDTADLVFRSNTKWYKANITNIITNIDTDTDTDFIIKK